MKAYEYLISWDVSGGYQHAYALVNAKSEKDAVGLILSRIPYHADAELKNKYPYDATLKNNIKVWYFSKDGKEHREIY